MQATWLRLFKRIQRIRDPAAFGGWLATTTRRESMRLLQ
jgi:DNA-directed RNA polymerase specialized sigma24 family protein